MDKAARESEPLIDEMKSNLTALRAAIVSGATLSISKQKISKLDHLKKYYGLKCLPVL
jgi:hypothetical protein